MGAKGRSESISHISNIKLKYVLEDMLTQFLKISYFLTNIFGIKSDVDVGSNIRNTDC